MGYARIIERRLTDIAKIELLIKCDRVGLGVEAGAGDFMGGIESEITIQPDRKRILVFI